ncbi:MAG: hypothetical protein DHS20C18_46610 [Saprospiraceae bacterium]|nr:MAG: hypothetical protein DHS20C18_46610 [Saprospiraceae bacterium]
MNKTAVLIIGLIAFSTAAWCQTLGEKFKLPEAAGELRADGVYHLPASLLDDKQLDVNAYFRFFEDGTFIIYHTRVTPAKNPENFQANCNYEFISGRAAPFNKDHKLKTSGNVVRSKINYPDRAVLLEMDVRTDVIEVTKKTFSKTGEKIGDYETYIMPFHKLSWPVANTVVKKQK